jgi:hypothetical protein
MCLIYLHYISASSVLCVGWSLTLIYLIHYPNHNITGTCDSVLDIRVTNMEKLMRVKGIDNEINTAETKCHATAKIKGRHACGKVLPGKNVSNIFLNDWKGHWMILKYWVSSIFRSTEYKLRDYCALSGEYYTRNYSTYTILSYFSLFYKNGKQGLWHHAVCVSACLPNNFWTIWLNFIRFGTEVMSFKRISML